MYPEFLQTSFSTYIYSSEWEGRKKPHIDMLLDYSFYIYLASSPLVNPTFLKNALIAFMIFIFQKKSPKPPPLSTLSVYPYPMIQQFQVSLQYKITDCAWFRHPFTTIFWFFSQLKLSSALQVSIPSTMYLTLHLSSMTVPSWSLCPIFCLSF